ncbi:ATP-binding protein [Campylobacter sp. MIT 97-5078]|uniref:ATP-binding protein n=1 Tax=Campylobacter sp. MIT 97-5078 TaxID=1548153 RepID=UPI000512F3CC|nr:ATP-binding protein [Campylobacter sp. MIT 97-5078]KGI55577.1 hypothetical protein LR59_11395 [Campylobacter sp. MIT 97-5078]TQR27287.1 ATP-binding protein [Campylobacter sp. MIT 97-5078]
MKILNFFYENPPEFKELFERKIRLNSKHTLLCGALKSGKKALILNYLRDFKTEEFLFLNFKDLRFSLQALENLEIFLQDKAIKIIVFYGIDVNFKFDFSKLLSRYQFILASEFLSLNFKDFEKIELDFLDFEEFLSQNSIKDATSSQLGNYLQSGRANLSENIELNDYLQSYFTALELEIFKFIALHLGLEFSVNALYTKLKKEMKISKDKLYECINLLCQRGLIFFVPHHQKRLKRTYFTDFAFKNALLIQRDFSTLFANLVLCELFKFKQPIFYTKEFDFYLEKSKIGFICSALQDIDLLRLKAQKILPKVLEKEIFHVVFITLSSQDQFFEQGVKFEIVPFETWALSF